MRANVADILCIGAQRAMTSWLHNLLAAHPRTWTFPNFDPVTSTSKEAHFWDWNHHRGPDWYRVLMRPLGDPALLSMDFTPEYALMSDAQIAECATLNPQARVIYITRDPLARAVSALRMHRMWRTNSAPVADAPIGMDQIRQIAPDARLWDHCEYAANAARWQARYQVLILNAEDLITDPAAQITRILAHCGLDWPAESAPAHAEMTRRMARRVWQTPAYPVDSDALYFLHGATWRARSAAQADLGLTFTEGARLLAGAA